ncbi:MAG: hypothetical protein ACM3ZE_05280 [Myxococcales bacterium]
MALVWAGITWAIRRTKAALVRRMRLPELGRPSQAVILDPIRSRTAASAWPRTRVWGGAPRRACVCRVTDAELWTKLSVRVMQGDAIRGTKYTLPAKTGARLPGLFTDANTFPLHLEFLQRAFPDAFANLSGAEYSRLIFDPSQREFFAGVHCRVLNRWSGGGLWVHDLG